MFWIAKRHDLGGNCTFSTELVQLERTFSTEKVLFAQKMVILAKFRRLPYWADLLPLHSLQQVLDLLGIWGVLFRNVRFGV